MKIVAPLLIAIFFSLLGLLNNNGFFDFGILYLFGVKGLGGIDFSFIKVFIEELLNFPDFLNNRYSENFKSFSIKNCFPLSAISIKMHFIFFFYFTFSFIIALSLSMFSFKRDKIYFVSIIIGLYLLLLYFT